MMVNPILSKNSLFLLMKTMDLDTKSICRLCLQPSDDVVNIRSTFQDSTIASILSKHFWFQIHKNDGLTESLCQVCWFQTKTFHQFYQKVEQFQKCFLDSANFVKKDVSDKDATTTNDGIDAEDAELQAELNEVKCEETKLIAATINTQISGEDSSDDDNVSDECEEENTTDGEEEADQSSSNNKKDDDDVTSPIVTRKGHLSPSEKTELEGQIRELFNMKCEICSDDVEFETLLKAKQHYRKVNDTPGYITCCGKKFALRYDVVQHIRYHSNSEAIQLERQIRYLFSLKCEICSDVEFETLSVARKHYRKVHKKKGYLKCSHHICCDKKFIKRFELLTHIRYHTDPDAYQCGQCSKKFKDENALKNHMYSHIPTDSREFKCTLCPRRFARRYKLKNHVLNKHNGEKFPCIKCGKNFTSSLLLGSHIRQVHELTQEYVCEVCARQFKIKTALQHHISYEHSTTPRPKVQCNVCGAWLKHELGLRNHLRRHNDLKPVNCPLCDKVVRDKRFLDKHIAYVHGEKRFPCTLCDKSFKVAKNLKEHIATHTGEDLYNCQYCDKKFKSDANMYKHRKLVHLAEWTQDCLQRKKTSTKVSVELNA